MAGRARDARDGLKLCVNCDHYGLEKGIHNSCYHPSNLDLVDGSPIHLCSIMRQTDSCGPEGKLFTPKKEPVTKGLLNWFRTGIFP